MVQIPATREFSILQIVQSPVWDSHDLFHMHRSSFRRETASGCDVELSPSSGTVIKNGWSYTFTTLIRLHGVDKDKFTFYFVVLSK